jgi:hypothetical protein
MRKAQVKTQEKHCFYGVECDLVARPQSPLLAGFVALGEKRVFLR